MQRRFSLHRRRERGGLYQTYPWCEAVRRFRTVHCLFWDYLHVREWVLEFPALKRSG